MIVTRAIRVLINRCVESLHQPRRKKGNAGRFSPRQGPIESSIDKRAQGENTDWVRPWRSFQSWGL
jgi:hypothetical protein